MTTRINLLLTHLIFNISASLAYYCHTPTSWTPPPYFNESIVVDMKRDFNLEELEKNNAQSIKGENCVSLLSSSVDRPIEVLSVYMGFVSSPAIKGPHLASSILFQSSGLTNGIIEEKDIHEELPKRKERKQEEEEDDKDSDQEIIDEEVDVSVSSMSCLKLK